MNNKYIKIHHSQYYKLDYPTYEAFNDCLFYSGLCDNSLVQMVFSSFNMIEMLKLNVNKDTIMLPSSYNNHKIVGILDCAFEHDRALNVKKIIIEEGVKFIDQKAFAGDCILEEIILPDSLECVYACVFDHCENLQRIKIGKGIKYFDACSFDNTNLQEILIHTSTNAKELFRDSSSIDWNIVKYYE